MKKIILAFCLFALASCTATQGIPISEKKEGYLVSCEYFSGRNTFYKSWWNTLALVRTDEVRDNCPFISKP